MSLCCICNSREQWAGNMYCFECYKEITSTPNHISKNLVNREYEYMRQEKMIPSNMNQKKTSKKVLGEIKKAECKNYRLKLFTGKARESFNIKNVKSRVIVVNSPKKKNVQLSLFIDEENAIAYFPEDVYASYVEIVCKYFK